MSLDGGKAMEDVLYEQLEAEEVSTRYNAGVDRVAQLEAQLQEADVTSTAMGLAYSEMKRENERLREALALSGDAIDRAVTAINFRSEGYEEAANDCDKEVEAFSQLRDELLKKEGA